DGVGRPMLVRGAIDLAFREEDGWAIADFKTDRKPAGGWKALAETYAPQLRLYAKAFERCTGEKVKETGLFFTREGAYVRVDA
ncbi:MAG: PD-(D/E)XK nuclease family protein, partial [Planctomycetes bacterium]|nr:PD-(D/E)XK nuclease family protein [Planctomycetota bacterium]